MNMLQPPFSTCRFHSCHPLLLPPLPHDLCPRWDSSQVVKRKPKSLLQKNRPVFGNAADLLLTTNRFNIWKELTSENCTNEIAVWLFHSPTLKWLPLATTKHPLNTSFTSRWAPCFDGGAMQCSTRNQSASAHDTSASGRSAHHRRQHSLMSRMSRKNKLDNCFYKINVMCKRHNCLFLEHSRDETVYFFVSRFLSCLSLSVSVTANSRIIQFHSVAHQ